MRFELLMDSSTPSTGSAARSPSVAPLSATMAILLAISFGLCAGYLDLAFIIFKRYCWNPEGYLRSARDFAWTVPLGHVVLLLAAGLVVAAVNCAATRCISLRASSWTFATLGISGAMLRMPLYVPCILLLAAGLGRAISGVVAARCPQPRQLRRVLAALLGVLGLLALLSSGVQSLEEHRSLAQLPAAAPGARNVVLIVWDAVRAYNLSLYGYPRKTTPNLDRWARNGVKYDLAVAPAPWTYPSHTSFFTGQWPYRLNSQSKFILDTPSSTLAEYLTSQGYQTAGFSANTTCCSFEGGLARGFAHFEDYILAPRSLLSRTIPGQWILENIVDFGDFYNMKWDSVQSRCARDVNTAFSSWLSRRRSDRPFFAFLNLFDAHDPYIPPPAHLGRFGIVPTTGREFQYLVYYAEGPKDLANVRDLMMARDCYDDCIAYLDQELGQLLAGLRNRGLLDNTVVIITSDHGEAFGDHGFTGHSDTVCLDEIGVPLVIFSPGGPAGQVVKSPVSLRDLPATIVDLLGLSAGSPFPGRSLAAYWRPAPGASAPEISSPAFSEQADATAFQAQAERLPGHAGFQMSLIAGNQHYIRDGMGREKFYNLTTDPYERQDLMNTPYGMAEAVPFRRKLLDLVTAAPGPTEVEKAYLERYRQALRSDVQRDSPQQIADGS
jgi:arylsulfatase A-like enzyme